MNADKILKLASIFELSADAAPISDTHWFLKAIAAFETVVPNGGDITSQNPNTSAPVLDSTLRTPDTSMPIVPSAPETKPLQSHVREKITDGNFEQNLARFLNSKTSDEKFTKDFEGWLTNNISFIEPYISNYWNFDNRGIKFPQPNLYTFRYTDTDSTPVRIFKQPVKDIGESKVSLLKGFGMFPNMFMYEGEDADTYGTKGSIPKELAQDSFIMEAVTHMFNYGYSPTLYSLMGEFVKQYKSNIDSLRKSFQHSPKYLGGGADGVAFSIGQGYILKIFQEAHSYNEAKKAMERLHKNKELAKTEAMIYDVGILGNFNGKNLYYYIMEEMTPINTKSPIFIECVRSIGSDIFTEIFKNHKREVKDLKSVIKDGNTKVDIDFMVRNIAIDIVEQIREKDARYIREVENLADLKDTWLESFAEELIMKYLTSRTDLHMGNIGITNQGELRYFDPSHQGWTGSKVNLPHQGKEQTSLPPVNPKDIGTKDIG